MKQFTREEVMEHSSTDSYWIIIGKYVYDITKFLEEHPGGSEVLMGTPGEDRLDDFEAIGHSSDAVEMREQYLIGELVESKADDAPPEKCPVAAEA
ncbi:cytochrome b5 [Aphelenchoides avenae]|nr:cytochrome b5 [Aphelenchus avenae]